MNHLDFLEREFSEDFVQEVQSLFTQFHGDEDVQEFSRVAARHFYRMAREYGYRRQRGDTRYVSYEKPGFVSPEQDDDLQVGIADSPDMVVPSAMEDTAVERITMEKIAEVMEQTLSPKETQLLAFFAHGYSLGDCCLLLGAERPTVEEEFYTAVRKIRDVLHCDPNIPLPSFNRKSQLKADQRHGAGVQPSAAPRVPVLMDAVTLQGMKLERLQELFGVSRATAWRIKKRGWYAPDYPRSSKKSSS